MTSRIIVKNIPTNIDEKKLKEIFSKQGVVTDVKICFKGQKHRRFCFIGYKNSQDAQNALIYFNNTYLQMNKLSVQFAKTLDDPDLPKTWSKYTNVYYIQNFQNYIKFRNKQIIKMKNKNNQSKIKIQKNKIMINKKNLTHLKFLRNKNFKNIQIQ
ncbi:RNA binding motif protein 19, putative [Ichthyophthirius multifiliis]|uniref:RNA binding motif protein 19, putative n=1 Tax=Ichthyophthirius multifiliis TaxID=5932 RepID=G0QX70_ICHMU|nr:RNA binding motif protein 19, putative [Ichthyophthirius multifiliis]EGR30187.1 RNA binding motif protein 19, putative [Ichthyophthirius multifiliis]|eukprot:XP_004031783.1 RNA binding motif protein 19, putative [Ichthyophthirius multifiliis]